MKFCDRCRRVDMSVARSKLKVAGITPTGKCGCIFLCVGCRDELIRLINEAADA